MHYIYSRLPACLLLCGLLTTGCSKEKSVEPDKADSKEVAESGSTAQHDAAIARLFVPPLEHVATPMPILARSLAGGHAGEVMLGKNNKHQELSHMGLGRCLDGWVLLGYTPEKNVLEPLYIPQATLPKGQWEIKAGDHPFGEAITLNLVSASAELLQGEATVQRHGNKHVEKWTFKTKPEQLAAANNMGHLGCHHTGFARLSMGSHKSITPVRSRFIAPDKYRISVALNETHRVEIWFDLLTHKRKPGHRIKADLAKLLSAPADYAQRVVFEHLDPQTNQYVKTPASAGMLDIHFEQNKLGGPVLFHVKNLKMETPWPEFKEAMTAHPLNIKGFVEFSTDRMGRQIPIHRMPKE